MPEPKSEGDRGGPGLPARLWKWLDQRTGVDQTLRHSLDEPIPGGARLAYVFGSALLFIFLSQIVTGLCLALYYVPAPMIAHVSVAYIVKEVAAGSFLRSLHSYGSSAMVVVLVLHFLQTFLYGSYKGKRELLWISGCTLALLVLGMAFTGYLLSWDQSAYSAASVGTDIVGQLPFIGESIRLLLRGGALMGALTLSRFYVLHLFLIPALMFSLIAAHLVLFRKAGAAGPVNEDPAKPRLPPEMFYPKQVLIDMTFVFLVMGLLGMLAHFVPVPLGLEADPANTTYLPRPEWYFLPMFQWLKYWEGWRTVIGIFVIPIILGGLILLLPFLDRGAERRPWRRPISVGGVLIVLIGVLWLGLTSRLEDSRDPIVAAQLAHQSQEESVYSHAAFQPYSTSPTSGAVASAVPGATAAQGKGIYDSHGCNGCHGASGGGATGPALTHIGSQYQPAQLAALLKAPTAKMKAAGMVPLTLDATELSALCSYLASFGGAPAAAAAAPSSSGSPAPASTATSGPSKAPPGNNPPPASASAAKKSPAKTGSGEKIYKAQGCASCHGDGGKGTQKAPALTDVGKKLSASQMATVLHKPTAKMTAGGMPPVKVSKQDLTALVTYLKGLGSPAGPQAPGAAATPANQSAPPSQPQTPAAPATAAPAPAQPQAQSAQPAGGAQAAAGPSNQRGEGIFKAQGCASCHGAGGVGTSRGPALTKLAGTMTPEALTAVLQHPTHQMQSGGMPAVSLAAKDLAALVAYLHSLGAHPGAAPAAAAATPAAASPAASNPAAKGAQQPPMNAQELKGQATFQARGCANCHGTNGAGGTAAAPALAGTGATLPPALLTRMLEHPTARMQHGGMPPVSLSGDELKELIAYVSYISASKASPR